MLIGSARMLTYINPWGPRFWLLGLAWWSLFCCACQPTPQPTAKFLREVEWIDKGVWLKADTHLHTNFSDGSNDLADVISQGVKHGCQVLAITDHADTELRAASEEYFAEIDAARKQHPEMVIIAGLEWNVPPWKGAEHATLLVPHNDFERKMLLDFKTQFDDWQRTAEQRPADWAAQALQWLSAQGDRVPQGQPLVIYNHPSRKRNDTQSFVSEFTAWRKLNSVAIGFEGAPGHQEMDPIGDYKQTLKTVNRWDPTVAPGDAWDALLRQGIDVWGAIATSDFHSASPQQRDDYWPGEFSETWLYAPEKSSRGVFAALRAGTFFAAHGHIAREVELTVNATGLPRPAHVGEMVFVPENANISIQLRVTIPDHDWQDAANQIDLLEILAILPQETKVIQSQPPNQQGLVEVMWPVPKEGLVIRARGIRNVPNEPAQMFYTNSIRIQSGLAPRN